MNASKQPIALHVLSSEKDSATRQLHMLMRQRETLRPIFRATWDDLSHHFDASELEAWAGAEAEDPVLAEAAGWARARLTPESQ